MLVRAASIHALVGLACLTPACAQNAVTPGTVLAEKHAHGFSGRTARITSIMGPDMNVAAPLRLPSKPTWPRGVRRDADATAGLR